LHKPTIKKLARTLLASSCLTVAAHATTLSEPPDFSNDINMATSIPAGTTLIQGSLEGQNDFSDQLIWMNLTPGSILNFSFSRTGSGIYGYAPVTSGNNPLADGANSVTIGPDGVVRFELYLEGTPGNYALDFGSAVPEPGTLTTLGLGAAAIALAARRKAGK
jgi:hypothetical protein